MNEARNGRTHDCPIPCAGYSESLTFHLPTAMKTQGGEPDSVHGVRASVPAFAAQIQRIYKIVSGNREHGCAGPLILGIKGPSATRYGDIPRCRVKCRKDRNPRGELICMVADDEAPRVEVWVVVNIWVECVDVETGFGGLWVMGPRGSGTEIDALAVITFCRKDVGQKTVSAPADR